MFVGRTRASANPADARVAWTVPNGIASPTPTAGTTHGVKLTPKLVIWTGLSALLSLVLYRRIAALREEQEPERLQKRVEDRLDVLEARMEESRPG